MEQLIHSPQTPWQFVDAHNCLHLTVQTDKENIQSILCHYCDPCRTVTAQDGAQLPLLQTAPMHLKLRGLLGDYYSLTLPLTTHKLRYHFEVLSNGETFYCDETGISEKKEEAFLRPYFVSYTYPPLPSAAWAADMVWYQIIPDRFAQEEGKSEAWESRPISDKGTFCPGTFKGIEDKLPYLKQLGITGIYLNPIWAASSIHRYDIVDYLTVAPSLGTEEELVHLCDCCHSMGLKVMLDGVYNHCSSDCRQFQDVLKNGQKSRYAQWFVFRDYDQLVGFDPASWEGDLPYESFAFVPTMPKWNTQNPEVADYLIRSAEYWTERLGVDAWRLDVPDEVHPDFLRAFRKRLKAINRELYIIGEIWSTPRFWLTGDMFDGVMNYPQYYAIRDFLAKKRIGATRCAELLEQKLTSNGDVFQAGMFNFCSNHDIPRILWHCQGNGKLAGLCYLLNALLPGGLCIYYGDELGLTGGYDPDNRRLFPWPEEGAEQAMLPYLQAAIDLKGRNTLGMLRGISAPEEDVIVLRFDRGVAAINRSDHAVTLPDDTVIGPEGYTICFEG